MSDYSELEQRIHFVMAAEVDIQGAKWALEEGQHPDLEPQRRNDMIAELDEMLAEIHSKLATYHQEISEGHKTNATARMLFS